jgi:hypothetical protein
MARIEETARWTTLDGIEIKTEVSFSLTDESSPLVSYSRTAPFHGEIWVKQGDLMDPMRPAPESRLETSTGQVLVIRSQTWTHGGSRAQVAGVSGDFDALVAPGHQAD